MKTSRDPAREPLDDHRRALVRAELAAIADLGANYVAICTPYDPEFVPLLRFWVREARAKGLKVWFRGNWCGWEGWFDYPKWVNSYDRHIAATVDFIRGHPDLFESGDSFTLAPEPENSPVLGDPRANHRAPEFLAFLRNSYDATTAAFAAQRKRVNVNWLSVNGDIGREILDRETASHIGGLVTIDHYVKDVKQMIQYVDEIHQKLGCKVFIGEFGAPLININGDGWSEKAQASFVREIFEALWQRRDYVLGISYWVGAGGPSDGTRLFDQVGDGYRSRAVARVVRDYYRR